MWKLPALCNDSLIRRHYLGTHSVHALSQYCGISKRAKEEQIPDSEQTDLGVRLPATTKFKSARKRCILRSRLQMLNHTRELRGVRATPVQKYREIARCSVLHFSRYAGRRSDTEPAVNRNPGMTLSKPIRLYCTQQLCINFRSQLMVAGATKQYPVGISSTKRSGRHVIKGNHLRIYQI